MIKHASTSNVSCTKVSFFFYFKFKISDTYDEYIIKEKLILTLFFFPYAIWLLLAFGKYHNSTPRSSESRGTKGVKRNLLVMPLGWVTHEKKREEDSTW
jgi:hypothetical protein